MRGFVAALLILGSATAPASAQEPLVDDGYAIDLVTTPVLGSGRILGLGGAFTALADGVDGALWNPAAYGSRTLWELDWFEWELSLGLLRPSDDFFNSGREVADDLLVLTLGFRLQFGDIGLGALPRVFSYDLGSAQVGFTTGNYGLAFQLLDGQLVIGAGVRLGDLQITALDDTVDEVSMTGIGPELGMLLKLADQPWRLGVAARSAVRSERLDDDVQCDDRNGNGTCDWALPRDVYAPWELQVGFAVQIGSRPFNRRFVDPEIAEQRIEDEVTLDRWERERAQVERELGAGGNATAEADAYVWLPRRPRDPGFWQTEDRLRAREDESIEARVEQAEDAADAEVASLPRTYLLISTDLLVTGPTEDGVSIEGFVDQTMIHSGEEVSVSVRLGVEGEPWAGRLKLRAGTYLEPSRYRDRGHRIHGTGGFDLRLFTWDLFGLFDDFDLRIGANIDVAKDYLDWGVSVGFWH